MKQTFKQPETDLAIFEKLFQPEQPRKMKNKIEYRVRDLDESKKLDNSIISSKKLQLEVVSIGNMPSMRSFFIQPIAQN